MSGECEQTIYQHVTALLSSTMHFLRETGRHAICGSSWLHMHTCITNIQAALKCLYL